MMLYELDDIEKRALVMEIKPQKDPVEEARELLSKATPGPWEKGKDIECQNEPDNCWHVFEKQAEIFPPLGEAGPVATVSQCDFDNAALIARTPALLTSLCDRVEAQAEDIRFLGDRLEAQAERMTDVVAERNQMRAAIEAADALIVKLYDEEAIPTLMQYEVDGVRGKLSNSLNPKGEQK